MKAYLWFMAVLFGLGLAVNLLARPGYVGRVNTASHLIGLAAFRAGVLVWTLVLLAGCGGGDPEDEAPGQPTPSVNCQARPELCK